MRFIIQVNTRTETRYLQNQETFKGATNRYWLFEEYKRNATEFETLKKAIETIAKLIIECWTWTSYKIYLVNDVESEGERFTLIKEISVIDYN